MSLSPKTNAAITLSKSDTQRLADIGFMGISRGRFAEAMSIFDAIATLKPDQEIGAIGQAMALLAMNKPGPAHDVLRVAPQTPGVMAFDCIALAHAGDKAAAEELNEELQEIAAGTPVAEMASAALQ